MGNTVMITLSTTIPDTEVAKDATVTIGTSTYQGKVSAILIFADEENPPSPPVTTVILQAPGLQTVPSK